MNTHIPKAIHISWKDKDIIKNSHVFNQNCLLNLIDLNPGWECFVNTDQEIDNYLKNNLEVYDYNLIKDKHIVEKSDLWRLLKLYLEGGLYVDIDRLCNTSLDSILKEETKCLLPTCLDHDFSQDFMCSAAGNPIYLKTIELVLSRRRDGHENIYFLGPQTYMHGITSTILGEIVDVSPDIKTFNEIRSILNQMPFIQTYREHPVYDTVIYRKENKQIDFDYELEKQKFYHEYNIKHWTNVW